MPSPAGHSHDHCIDTLRLSSHAAELIHHQLDQRAAHAHRTEHRQHERLPYHRHAGLVVRMIHPGGNHAHYLVRPRNLSRHGMGFLHGTFIYTETPCVVTLVRLDGSPVQVEGRVTRCQHIRDNLHDIGVRFNQPIRLSQFVPGYRSHRDGPVAPVQPDCRRLSGRVVVADAHIDDREILRYWLNEMGIEVGLCQTAAQLPERLNGQACHMLLLDPDLLGGDKLAEVLARIVPPYRGPVVALTSDERSETADRLVGQGFCSILTKPIYRHELAMLLSSYLLPSDEQDHCGLLSTLWDKPSLRPLIINFLHRLSEQYQQLLQAVSQGDCQTLARLCRDLKGTAGNFGFPQISSLARELQLLAQNQANLKLKAMHQKLAELQRLCDAALQVIRTPARP